LAFHHLEKSIIKNYKLRKLGRMKRLLKKKWKKLLPVINEGQLMTEKAADPKEHKKAIDILILYSRLYSDLIDPSSVEKCGQCITRLTSLKMVPSLKDELEGEIEKLTAVKIPAAKRGIKTTASKGAEDTPHLNDEVRRRLVKHFKKRMREEEPLLMLDPLLELRIENLIRRHVDRIIDVFLEHSYKAMQNGYIGRSSEGLSAYVELKGMESIDWTIKNGVLIDEIVRSIS